MASRTVTQRSNADGFPKAGEVIEMTGLEDLEKLCLDWERHCMIGNAAAEDPC